MPVFPEVCEVEAKNLRFFASTSQTSGKTGFILYGEKFATTHTL